MRKKTVTIKEVAKTAGVSIATVSAVVNEHSKKIPLSDKARTSVLKAIKKLNYQVNTQARMLRTGRSYTIGVIASDLTQPFTGECIRLVEKAVAERDYHFLLSDIQNSKVKEQFYLDLFRQKQVEGILYIGASNEMDGKAVIDIVKEGLPVVLTEREEPTHNVPCILVDNKKGAYLATEHLISLGHKKIAHISGPKTNIISQHRFEGYHRALKEKNLDDLTFVQEIERLGLAEGYLAMDRILDRADRPSAVFAFNDTVAFGAMRAAQDAGLSIPEDMAIVGYDDIPMTSYSEPTLTTVRQPVLDMSRLGVEMLLDLLEGKHPKGYYAKIVLQPELVVRKSSNTIKHGS